MRPEFYLLSFFLQMDTVQMFRSLDLAASHENISHIKTGLFFLRQY